MHKPEKTELNLKMFQQVALQAKNKIKSNKNSLQICDKAFRLYSDCRPKSIILPYPDSVQTDLNKSGHERASHEM